jgi:hypothetical protein
MNLTDVLAILNKTVKLSQPITDALQRWRDVYYGISLHTTGACPRFRDAITGRTVTPPGYFGQEYQYLFDNYLLNRHPRENEATRNWRYSQYRPLTKAPFGQITEIVTGAIFQDSNYVIEIEDKSDEGYIWGNHFSGHDIAGYFSNIGFRNMVEDPNGVFLRIPSQSCNEQDSDKVAVDIWFINTKDMVLFTPTDLIFKRDGYVWWVNEQTIWRFAYKADKKLYCLAAEDVDGYYAHMLGRLPVSIAGGEWNTQGHYDSFFSKAKAAADDFISAYSAAQLVDKEASHPFIVEASTDCDSCMGRGAVQHDCESCPGGVELVTCNTCHGSGQVSRNPGQHIIIPHDKLKDGTPIQIINPDISINSHHRDVCTQVMDLLTEALHLRKTDAAQSGTAKAIDQERLYKFINTISNHLFDKILYDTLRDVVAYRNVANVGGRVYPAQQPFRLQKPTQFRIKTAADLLAEFNEGTRAAMPVFIRQRMALDFVDKQYSGDAWMKLKMQLINKLDNLAVLSSNEVLDLLAVQIIGRDDVLYSQKLPQVLDMIAREYGYQWFSTATTEMVAAEVEKYMQAEVDTVRYSLN